MEQRQLGDSGLYTSAIGFGTWEMSTTMYGHIDVGEAAEAVHAAIDHGITLFDTAEVYGPYHSERLLAKALGNKRRDIILVSKVGFNYDEDDRNTGRNSSYDNVIERTEGCLQRLETDYLDLLLIHWPDHDTPFEETMSALNKLKDDGKIRHYGVSNFTPEMMAECERHGHLAANQVGYHICSTGGWSRRFCRSAPSTTSASWPTALSDSACCRERLRPRQRSTRAIGAEAAARSGCRCSSPMSLVGS